MRGGLGACRVDPSDDGAKSAVDDLTDGLGADIAVETVGGFGNDATPVQAVYMTRVMGRIVVLGVFHEPTLTDWMQPLLKEQSIIFIGLLWDHGRQARLRDGR